MQTLNKTHIGTIALYAFLIGIVVPCSAFVMGLSIPVVLPFVDVDPFFFGVGFAAAYATVAATYFTYLFVRERARNAEIGSFSQIFADSLDAKLVKRVVDGYEEGDQLDPERWSGLPRRVASALYGVVSLYDRDTIALCQERDRLNERADELFEATPVKALVDAMYALYTQHGSSFFDDPNWSAIEWWVNDQAKMRGYGNWFDCYRGRRDGVSMDNDQRAAEVEAKASGVLTPSADGGGFGTPAVAQTPPPADPDAYLAKEGGPYAGLQRQINTNAVDGPLSYGYMLGSLTHTVAQAFDGWNADRERLVTLYKSLLLQGPDGIRSALRELESIIGQRFVPESDDALPEEEPLFVVQARERVDSLRALVLRNDTNAKVTEAGHIINELRAVSYLLSPTPPQA